VIAMKIVWTDKALLDYHQNIDYLLSEWNERSAIEFIDDVDAMIALINAMPELFPLSDYLNVRRAVVRKQITLFYSIEGSKIYLLRFWNIYQNPSSLKF